ncbi:DGQHR domain-containing protein [Maribacter sp. ANRC-HE7]|uniref:DGQHR domain-containing protein n=1 Tax=Maribacter aquimaris TaxID=2737171 RepID=A0ABR7V5R3_9FLAO|nr:DGQHR domain-containing protein [Maribacter aquimaris]MBD0779300.1 DGQHR domain-containing protein [Maribacter aquimaris]
MIKLNYIKVEQPIGEFYITSIDASTLAKVVIIERRNDNPDAVQREQSEKRIKEIAKYTGDSDATFPTPIIIAVDDNAKINIDEKNQIITFEDNQIIGEVIDGQHRLEGIKSSNNIGKFQLPCVLMFNLFPEQKAYVFSIINSKQTRVNMSLIYDLFALSTTRSPYKTCHETARAFNKEKDSPFYNRLKMLGKKTDDQELASLSQGTFIKYMLELISKNPDEDMRNLKNGQSLQEDKRCVLRNYFIDEKDAIIYKIMFNLYSAVKFVFTDEWNNPNHYIISKSIGFGAVIKAFPEIYEIGIIKNKLTKDFFIEIFQQFKQDLADKEIELTSKYFGSNEQARMKLANLIKESAKKSPLSKKI